MKDEVLRVLSRGTDLDEEMVLGKPVRNKIRGIGLSFK